VGWERQVQSKAGYLIRKKEVVTSFKHVVPAVSHNRMGLYTEISQCDIRRRMVSESTWAQSNAMASVAWREWVLTSVGKGPFLLLISEIQLPFHIAPMPVTPEKIKDRFAEVCSHLVRVSTSVYCVAVYFKHHCSNRSKQLHTADY
jgi:hypothetical protein